MDDAATTPDLEDLMLKIGRRPISWLILERLRDLTQRLRLAADLT